MYVANDGGVTSVTWCVYNEQRELLKGSETEVENVDGVSAISTTGLFPILEGDDFVFWGVSDGKRTRRDALKEAEVGSWLR